MTRTGAQMRYDDEEKTTWECGSWCEYIFVVVVSSILLLAAIVMTVFWIIFYRQGYSLEEPIKEFNFHPTLMITGFITLTGFSLLLYRICRCCSSLLVNLCHTFFHAASIPCIVLAFLAVFDSKNATQPPTPHFYSLHSWLGLICMGLFVFQFILGFFGFFILLCCENATHKFRSTLVPIHASLGLANFMLAIGAAITGLTEKALHELGKDTYSGMIEEGIIINTIAIILIALGILVPFAIRRSNSPASFKVYVTETI